MPVADVAEDCAHGRLPDECGACYLAAHPDVLPETRIGGRGRTKVRK